MNIKPLYDKVLVKRKEAETKTAGGIIIPDTSKEKPSIGIVLAVGDGAIDDSGKKLPMTLKVNDEILFTKWGGTEVPGNNDLVIIKESDVLGIIVK